MPQAVNGFCGKNKKSLVVTGTHGKTTTSSLLAWVLQEAGLNPSFIIGGIHKNFDSNYKKGNGEYIVLEGDEYDTAFFDKGAKFFHYKSYVSVITGIEFDHADIFRDLAQIRLTFKQFIDQHDSGSTIVVYGQDQNAVELSKGAPCSVINYGQAHNGKDQDKAIKEEGWRVAGLGVEPPWNRFEVFLRNEKFGRFRIKMPGDHNLNNALAVIAVAHRLGIKKDVIAKGFESFAGVKRRQEIRGIIKGITVVDDFAHHPTAVYETIKGFRPFCGQGRLIAVFEPRTNSSMRNVFQEAYAGAFEYADMVCIREIPLPEKIPADERFSSSMLVEDLQKRGQDATCFHNGEEIIRFLSRYAKSGDIILIMSNGGFENIHAKLLDRLSAG
jgi:UDP-N-acetylmuramate: L-alanyl-gamma-D-glutamyl-meso-diaminopimelate ligase